VAALGGAKQYVLVAQGIYREDLKLTEGAQLFGGYSSDFLKRDPQTHGTVIVGQPVSQAARARRSKRAGSPPRSSPAFRSSGGT